MLEPHTCLQRPMLTPVKIHPDFQHDMPCRMKRFTSKRCSCDSRKILKSKQSLPYYENEYEYDLSAEKNCVPRDHVHQIYHTSVYHNPCLKEETCFYPDEYEHIYTGKGEKKVLYNYEELPSVDEQQERFGSSTYRMPYSKCVDVIPANNKISKKKSDGIIEDSPAEYIYQPKETITADLNKKLPRKIYSPKVSKMRSRRTRLNRIKEGWKKAVVHASKYYFSF